LTRARQQADNNHMQGEQDSCNS